MKKTRHLFSFLLLLFVFETRETYAQNLDSLYSVWQDKTQPDSSRVNAFARLTWVGYLYSQPDTAELMAKALHAYAKEHHYPSASTQGYNIQGLANWIQGNYSASIEYFHKSLAILDELGDKKGIAGVLGNISIIYEEQGNYPRALEYCQKSLLIDEEFGDKKGIATNLSNIGIIYKNLENHSLAHEYSQKGFKVWKEIDDKDGIALCLINIGIIYAEQENYAQALEYYEQGLKILEETGDKYRISGTLLNIGNIYYNQGNSPLAFKYFQKSLAINEEIGDKKGVAQNMANIGVLYQKQGNHTLALYYCKKGLTLSEEIGALDQQQHACGCLYNTYKDLEDNKEALKYYEQMIMVRDSLFNEENTKKLTRLEMQYEFDKKEAVAKVEQDKKDAVAAQELQRQKLVRNGFMGGFAVVLLFAGVVFIQRNKISKEKAISEELLLNILPEETARELKTKGSADAQLIDHVTVLFTDFKGFTAMSENLSPKELVEDLHQCFSAFDHIMEQYGIEKIKTIGDAYMAAGGLPTPNKTHAKDVVVAALEMAEVVERGKAVKIAEGLPFFEVRIGIHTGPVVAGIVGVKKFQYDIWGDTVNTASRMESSGSVGRVNISQSTYELLNKDPELNFESRGKIKAKGKGEIEMWYATFKE